MSPEDILLESINMSIANWDSAEFRRSQCQKLIKSIQIHGSSYISAFYSDNGKKTPETRKT